ncbi:MAG: NAD(P)H-dependent oxidoreductase [SAR324 cluster bacterium]|nr:NAD(P)H-dependent oxidoreductase [SAR324 cluster bacterium]
MNKILILFAHPALEKSIVNKSLFSALQGLEKITTHDLYEVYPDFFIDVTFEQELLKEHDIIVFQHPLYWYSSPALLKKWQDLVLEHGFAYGEGATALHGKKLLSAITTGGIREAYQKNGVNRYTIRQILTPFDQSAHFCGMEYLPPFVVHGARLEDNCGNTDRLAREYQTLILALRDNRLNYQEIRQYEYLNQCLDLLNP